MIVYRSIYDTFAEPSVINKELVMAGSLNVIKFKIVTIPHNSSIYNLLHDYKEYANLETIQDECSIFFVSDFILNDEVKSQIENFIQKQFNAKPNENCEVVHYFANRTSVSSCIDFYSSITLHIPTHSVRGDQNDSFHYINYRSINRPELIDMNNSIVQYVKLKDRHHFSTVHGKLRENNTVSLFHHYPVECDKVYILPDSFNILTQGYNKIAYYNHDNFIFWIVTHHTFISESGQPTSSIINTTKFCPQELSADSVSAIFNIFAEYGFDTPSIEKSSIVARDDNCSLLMYAGIYNLQHGNEYSKYFANIGLK
nr:hypothetical protein MmNV_27 [Menippe mercenaria nudivirus]